MAAIDELKQLLNQDVSDLNQLAFLLDEEKAKLKSSDIRAIEPSTEQKNRMLGQIRERAKRKIHALVEMGYCPEHGEPSRFIRSAGLSELTSLWQAAETALKACQERNRVNGRIISHLQNRLTKLTDIFKGSAGQAKLYGSSGQQTSVGQSNILASA